MGVLELTILVDNRAEQGLTPEHGFSAWIEWAGRRLLFDTGQGQALAGNAERLGIDLRRADTLILSHGHYDHTGGLPLALERAPAVQVYAHPAATGVRYAVRAGVARSNGMPERARVAFDRVPAGAVHWTAQPVEFAPRAGVTGTIPRLTGYEDPGGPFFLDAEGTEPDPVADDVAAWFRTGRGLVVVLGCGHAGVVNTVRQAQRVSGEPRVHAVLGGFHLGEASEARLERTTEALGELAPDMVVPCHCTGDRAAARLERALGGRVVRGFAGARYALGGG